MKHQVKLYVMRHGEAMPAQALKGDAIRPLSGFGEQEVLMNAQWLKSYLAQQGSQQLDWLLVSPLVRARQTATILTSQVPAREQQTSHDITPEGRAAVFADWLLTELQRRGPKVKQVAVVSHMPFVSYLMAELDPQVEPMLFPTAGIAELTLSVDDWHGEFIRMAVAEPA
ncbi:phosphohistidine phosphatase SixA [Pseudidiomarina insulisalsae]|uniref:Phosphohistidine phosphatase SixA n=1 Tax=Pseudidiomarina insulisalsae TaxID=575789 RepID=A0A432YCD4_9GAMM|nr:phosphohistidine phosphatase SixA [Pseudidiomarina insulisalsae]RUO58587.1 phosphohistidine phosphatase SixA [Pseudidiomarina insulisalsae]